MCRWNGVSLNWKNDVLFSNAKVLKNIREDRKIIEVFIANQNAQADENAKRLSGMRFFREIHVFRNL